MVGTLLESARGQKQFASSAMSSLRSELRSFSLGNHLSREFNNNIGSLEPRVYEMPYRSDQESSSLRTLSMSLWNLLDAPG